MMCDGRVESYTTAARRAAGGLDGRRSSREKVETSGRASTRRCKGVHHSLRWRMKEFIILNMFMLARSCVLQPPSANMRAIILHDSYSSMEYSPNGGKRGFYSRPELCQVPGAPHVPDMTQVVAPYVYMNMYVSAGMFAGAFGC